MQRTRTITLLILCAITALTACNAQTNSKPERAKTEQEKRPMANNLAARIPAPQGYKHICVRRCSMNCSNCICSLRDRKSVV